MEAFNQEFPFLWDDLFPNQVDEQSTSHTLGIVPIEIIDLIASFIPRRTLPTFSLVDSRCRAVATRYIYHSVTINGPLFSITSKDPDTKLPSATSPINEILDASTIKACRTLKGLLSNDQAIAAIRSFQIQGHPSYSDRPYFVAFMKHIWQSANLKQIDHRYFPSSPITLPDPCWPDTLEHLTAKHVCWWGLKALAYPTMRHLTLTTCTNSTRKLQNRDLTHITRFEYLWHDWKEDFELFNFDWIATTFPNLRMLKIGICDCWVNQDIPDKFYLAALHGLVAKLPHLDTFIIGEQESNSANAEESLSASLENAQPSLKKITFQYRTFGDKGRAEVTWSRYGASLEAQAGRMKKLHSNEVRWTPNPMVVDRLHWWFTRFGLPYMSRPEMLRRWPDHVYEVPTEQTLCENVLEIITATLLKEGKCSREVKGHCDCVLCEC